MICKIRVCQRCGKEYQPTGNTQKYCAECGPAVKEEKNRACVTLWYKANTEKWKASHAKYRKANLEKCRAMAARRYKANPEKQRAWTVNWQKENPELVREFRRKENARRRTFGFIPLNSWFVGCEGHHINNNDVIYMPRKLHRSIYHNQSTGQGMEQINTLAHQWLARVAQ